MLKVEKLIFYELSLKTYRTPTNIMKPLNSKGAPLVKTFAPLVFPCLGEAGPSAAKIMNRLATMQSEKADYSYSDIITYIRTKLSFSDGSSSLKKYSVEASIVTMAEGGRLLLHA